MLKQKEIIDIIFYEANEQLDIPNSKEEEYIFNELIDYLKKQGFITEESQSDKHYSEIEDKLMYHYHVSLKHGFVYGFKTALTLLQGEKEKAPSGNLEQKAL